ncbi:MAG: hypothetical protein M1840_001030 [Geoglossum simile]|nr:MAG: hypothetical protein M1840_001030 [Geoglossum simile]
MAVSKEYFANDLLNFTVNDLQDFIEVKDPHNVTEKHLEVLRDLMRQRDEMAQAHAVDANELREKLKQISSSESTFRPSTFRPSSESTSSYTPTPPPDSPTEIERESYDTLVQEGGRPSHPIHLGFDVLSNPGEYKDIISYWDCIPGTGRLLYLTQLNVWRKFCERQRKIRQHYQNKFPDYQQKVRERRRRHGLEGDVELHRERDRQSRLDNWMEYQDYQYQFLERKEKDVEQAQEKLNSAQEELKEAGVPWFEGAYEPDNFGNYYGWAVELGRQEWELWKEMELAEKGLEAVKLDGSRENMGRYALTELAQKKVESAQKRLDSQESLVKRSNSEVNSWARDVR